MDPINENSGGPISLERAKAYTRAFRENFPGEARCFYIGCVNVELILNQEGCMGIRIYNGYNEETKSQNLVLVGVNRDGKDMTAGVIMDRLIPCPNSCDSSSPLNP